MELICVVLVNKLRFTLGEDNVTRVFMFNNDAAETHVTLKDGTILKIPFHSALYYI